MDCNEVIKTLFFDWFKCIADRCTNNCCKGRKIIIDEDTMDKYRKIEGRLGEKLRQNIVEKDEVLAVKLGDDGICPFQTENGLCEIVLEKGPSYLSHTCTVYPRSTFTYNDITEKSLFTSCPAVVEFLYEEKHLEFALSDFKTPSQFKIDYSERMSFDADVRRFFVNLLQLEGIPLWVRQYFVINLALKMQPKYDKGDYDGAADETLVYADLDYLAGYADKLMEIKRNDALKFKFIESLFSSLNWLHEKSLMKYSDKVTNSKIKISEMSDICRDFDNEVYNDIEYVFENLCVLNIFTYFLNRDDRLNMCERCYSVFVLFALVRFAMAVYWHLNGRSITKEEQIDIITIFSRKMMHAPNLIANFCRKMEEEGLFRPSYLLMITR